MFLSNDDHSPCNKSIEKKTGINWVGWKQRHLPTRSSTKDGNARPPRTNKQNEPSSAIRSIEIDL